MLFRPDYTSLKKGKLKALPASEDRDLKESFVGNSMHKGVLATLLAPVLREWGYLSELPVPALLGTPSKRLVGQDGSSPWVRLVRAYVSYQDHKGGIVVQESGQSRMRH